MSFQIELFGPGPFHLPAAEAATAEAGSDGVTVTFQVLTDQGRRNDSVSVQMPADVAAELAGQLAQAAAGIAKS